MTSQAFDVNWLGHKNWNRAVCQRHINRDNYIIWIDKDVNVHFSKVSLYISNNQIIIIIHLQIYPSNYFYMCV